MQKRFRLKQGFTLLELLVVISIIGILVALGAVSYTSAQQRGRDAKRRGDMKAVQNGFEQYYADNGGYATPTCSDMATATIMPGGLPSDPKPGQAYTFSCPSADSYCACAQLENDNGNANASDCSDWTAGGYFCVSNLQ